MISEKLVSYCCNLISSFSRKLTELLGVRSRYARRQRKLTVDFAENVGAKEAHYNDGSGQRVVGQQLPLAGTQVGPLDLIGR